MADRSRTRVFGRPPAQLIVPAVLAFGFILLPVVAVLVKAPWLTVPDALSTSGASTALRLSLETTLATTAICLLLGIPLAWLLARVQFPGRTVVRAIVLLPLVLPPVVAGVALLLALGRNGLVGRPLDEWFGITLPFSTKGVVVAQTFVALPFMVIATEGAFRASDSRFDDAAASLGASRWQTFRMVTLPLALPGIVAGAVLSWARALGEFGATITFAGSFPGTTQTMPIEVYTTLQTNFDTAIALSVVLIVVSVVILAALRERWVTGLAR